MLVSTCKSPFPFVGQPNLPLHPTLLPDKHHYSPTNRPVYSSPIAFRVCRDKCAAFAKKALQWLLRVFVLTGPDGHFCFTIFCACTGGPAALTPGKFFFRGKSSFPLSKWPALHPRARSAFGWTSPNAHFFPSLHFGLGICSPGCRVWPMRQKNQVEKTERDFFSVFPNHDRPREVPTRPAIPKPMERGMALCEGPSQQASGSRSTRGPHLLNGEEDSTENFPGVSAPAPQCRAQKCVKTKMPIGPGEPRRDPAKHWSAFFFAKLRRTLSGPYTNAMGIDSRCRRVMMFVRRCGVQGQIC